MNDGQNLFDAATSTFSSYEWRMDETAAELLRRGTIEPMIVVGVDNAGRRDRPLEYLPYPDEFLRPPVPRPRGLEYPRFLVDEVMPLIRRIYRTKPGPEATGVGGSSYGGVAALVAAMKRPGRLRPASPREPLALHLGRASPARRGRGQTLASTRLSRHRHEGDR